MLSVMIDEALVAQKQWNAAQWVKELAKDIKGGGGGQAYYATAGGSDVSGLSSALKRAESLLKQ